ncbi:MAG: hypothetical protein Q9179_004984 [Wetmoreana sp. 5 TL-2023]
MKQRFSSLDVKVIAHELSNALYSLRLANIYDLSSRIFLFKFAKPDHREQIIVDSGFRCHLTSFSRATAAAPSPFAAKLRKHLRTRRVTSVSQVGIDRILQIQFSDGQYRLFLEFYAGGNIVLTDRELNILSLLRIVPGGAGQEELRIGLKYGLENRQDSSSTMEWTSDRVRQTLQKALDNNSEGDVRQAKKKKSGDPLRKALAGSITEFPASLIDHALRSTGFEFSQPIAEVLGDEGLIQGLTAALKEAQRLVGDITRNKSSKGYILAKIKPGHTPSIAECNHSYPTDEAEPSHGCIMYEDFQPFRPLESASLEWKILEFESFNKTVDEFFSSIEGQRLESRLTEREQNAKRKIETARQDYEKRIGGLQQVQELNVRKAQAIEANLQRVQEVTGAVNGLIAQGMDWVEIARLIEMEQAKHNMVAEMIKLPLKLFENTITVLLAEETFDDEEDFGGSVTDGSTSESEDEARAQMTQVKASEAANKQLAIDIDLALSPWSNARQYYDQKKTAASKEQKTLQSSAKALRSTEKKINADLKKGLKQEKQVLRPMRKQLWFEKFHYFISSEGYLVLGGKDAQQNEILYKRYLKKGDIYVHADLHGAASIIVKNKPGRLDDPIPPSTLSQAGSFVVATSSAWDSKAVMSAWWVRREQVSKTAPTGEYLTTGRFTIHGEKNFLPPAHLLLGFGVLFRVNGESKARHLKHRLQDKKPEKVVDENATENNTDIEDDASSLDVAGHKEPQVPARLSDENIEASGSNSDDREAKKSVMDHGSDVETSSPLFSEKSGNGKPVVSQAQEKGATHSGMNEDDIPSDGQHEDGENSDIDVLESMHESAPPSTTSSRDASSVRHLSARGHRLLRKGQSPMAAAEDVFAVERDESTQAAAMPVRSLTNGKPSAAAQNFHVRGKHGKRAKLKTKYAGQDEEDRALAMRLLGSAATKKAIEDSAAKAAKEEELVAQQQRRRQQHLAAAERGKEEEEIRRLNLEEGLETFYQTEVEALDDLEAYIGTPFAGDEILDALVVCGPWDAIGTRCKWRAKLQPGSVKKGKAVREILAMWMKTTQDREKKKRPGAEEGNEEMIEEEKVRRREGDLLRGLREQEVVGVVPVGKVRVVMGGERSVSKGREGGAVGKGKRGGRGSKKQR